MKNLGTTHHLLRHEARVHASVAALDLGAQVLAVILACEEEAPVQVVVVALVLGHAQRLAEAVLVQAVQVPGEAFDHLRLIHVSFCCSNPLK